MTHAPGTEEESTSSTRLGEQTAAPLSLTEAITALAQDTADTIGNTAEEAIWRERLFRKVDRLRNCAAVDALNEAWHAWESVPLRRRKRGVRDYILGALVSLGDLPALAAVVKRLVAAGNDLGRIAENAQPFLPWLLKFGAVTTACLVERLRVGEPDERARSGELLAVLGDRHATAPLLDLLEQGSREVYLAASESLGMLGDKTVLPRLLCYVNDPEMCSDRRCAAANAIRLIEHDDLRRELKRRVKDALVVNAAGEYVDRSAWALISAEVFATFVMLAERYHTFDLWVDGHAWEKTYCLDRNEDTGKYALLVQYIDRIEGRAPLSFDETIPIDRIYDDNVITALFAGLVRVYTRTEASDYTEHVCLPSKRVVMREVKNPRWMAQVAEFPSLAQF